MKPSVIANANTPATKSTGSGPDMSQPSNGINIPINHEYTAGGSSTMPQQQYHHHQPQPQQQQQPYYSHPPSHQHHHHQQSQHYPDGYGGSPRTHQQQPQQPYPTHSQHQAPADSQVNIPTTFYYFTLAPSVFFMLIILNQL